MYFGAAMMARCLFCNEWAGVNARWHESCRLEFAQNTERDGLMRRLIASAMRTALAGIAVLLGLFSAPSRPSSHTAVSAQSSTARRMPRRATSDSEEQAARRQHPGDSQNS
jgi:hypothetical protein